jgi:caffeoyl-CoA O-methyltransferase
MNSYLQRILVPRSPVLARAEEHCARDHIPNIQPEAAQFIRVLLQMQGARRMLELGTAYGYSALHWCEAAPAANIVTIELDAGRAAIARSYFAAAGVADRVQLLEGDAGQLVPQLEGRFDVVFIDAAKGQYRLFFEQVLEKTRSGGLIVTDNVLFRGYVAAEDDRLIEPRYLKMVEKIRAFNRFISDHPACNTSIVPIGDGIAISRKI